MNGKKNLISIMSYMFCGIKSAQLLPIGSFFGLVKGKINDCIGSIIRIFKKKMGCCCCVLDINCIYVMTFIDD